MGSGKNIRNKTVCAWERLWDVYKSTKASKVLSSPLPHWSPYRTSKPLVENYWVYLSPKPPYYVEIGTDVSTEQDSPGYETKSMV